MKESQSNSETNIPPQDSSVFMSTGHQQNTSYAKRNKIKSKYRSPSGQALYLRYHKWVSPVAQTVKNLPAMWETWVRSLGWEDPLEEGMATYSSILAWRIPMDRGAWQAIVYRVTKSRTQLSD